jgi:membrane protein
VSTSGRLRALARDVVQATRGHDLALIAAGVTFYAAIGLIPMWLLALFLAGRLMGPDMVEELAAGLTGLLPDELGAREAAGFLASAGTSMSPLAALAALVPASLYGEGLVRAFDHFSDRPSRRRSARGRIGSLVVVALSPVLLLGGLSAAQALTTLLGDSTLDRVIGVYFAFLVGWFTISPVLAFAYRGLTLEKPGRRALLWGAAGTGSFLSGTCLGFLLFLSLGIDLGGAYGGATNLATAAACIGWLFVLHVIVLVGYVTTLVLEAREGHPLAAPVERVEVSTAA